MGRRVAQGLGYSQSYSLFDLIEKDRPTAYWNMLFPTLMAGCWLLFGEHVVLYRLVQVTIASTLPLPVAVLGSALFGPRVGWLAAAATALYPMLVYFSPLLITEPLFLALLYPGLALVLGTRAERVGLGRATWCGVLLALSCLVRSVNALPRAHRGGLARPDAAAMERGRDGAPRVRRVLGAVGLPQHRHVRRPDALRYEDGASAVGVPRRRADGRPRVIPMPPDLAGENEGRKNAELIRRGLAANLADPGTMLTSIYWKSRRFWSPLPKHSINARFTPLAAVTLGWIVPLGVVGALAWLARRRLRVAWPLHAIVLVVAAVSSLSQGGARQTLVIEPILLLFAVERIVALADWIAARRGAQA